MLYVACLRIPGASCGAYLSEGIPVFDTRDAAAFHALTHESKGDPYRPAVLAVRVGLPLSAGPVGRGVLAEPVELLPGDYEAAEVG